MRLAEIIRKWRQWAEFGQEQIARDIGISKATLSRFERTGECDGDTLAKILCWITRKG